MRKYLFAAASMLLFLLACNTTKTIKLTSTKGEFKRAELNHQYADAIKPDSAQILYAQKLGLDSFEVARFIYSPKKYYASWLNRELSDTVERAVMMRYHNIDTAMLYKRFSIDGADLSANEKIDTEILFLLGKKRNGEFVLVADQNNNKRFDDDSVYRFNNLVSGRYISWDLLKDKPRIQVTNLQIADRNKVHTYARNFILQPSIAVYYGYSKGYLDFLDLAVITDEFAVGNFTYKGQQFNISATNKLWPFEVPDSKLINVKFGLGSIKNSRQNLSYINGNFSVGDTVVLKPYAFKILSISPVLNTVKIKALKIN